MSTQKCNNCGGINREIAKYCKYCGDMLVAKIDTIFSPLEDLVGLDELKNSIVEMVDSTKEFYERSGKDKSTPLNLNVIIVGSAGTGKTKLSEILAKLYFNAGLVEKENPLCIDAVDYSSFMRDFDNNFAKAKDGVLIVDNIEKLVSKEESQEIHNLDKLLNRMEKSKNNPVVILCGRQTDGTKKFIDTPGVKTLFHIFKLEDLSPEQMHEIAIKQFKQLGFSLQKEADEKLFKLFKHLVKTKDSSFANGKEVEKRVDDIIKKHSSRITPSRPDNRKIQDEDIEGDIPEERTEEEILKALDSLIGLAEIKKTIRDLINQVKMEQDRIKKGLSKKTSISMHMVFTGNPGTGKTTVAKLLGEILAAIGVLPKGHVVTVDKSGLIAEYVGQTAPKVNKAVDEAMGGILFIDEAYGLVDNMKGGYGNDAIETLIQRMENDRGKFIVIAAGYPKEMEEFLNSNQGLRSRFNKTIYFEDYKPDELLAIFKHMAGEKNYEITPETEEKLSLVFQDKYSTRDKDFANGRTVRNIFEETERQMANRLAKLPDEDKNEHVLNTISPEDIKYDLPKKLTIDEIMNKLNNLIGMENIKNELRSLKNTIDVQKKRFALVGEEYKLDMHMVFTGNPGTGKTTIAKLLGEILAAIGVLPKGHVVTVDKSGLIAEYVGQTAPKVNKAVDEAMGGILFIDEAYGLVDNMKGGYGNDAIETLLQRMENDRGKFIVIAAGYPKEMEEFLNSNQGLRSRFNRFFHFEDYKPDELLEIYKVMAKAEKYTIDPEAEIKLKQLFNTLYSTRDKNFANGRTVRNIFQRSIILQSNRLVGVDNENELSIIRKEDIPDVTTAHNI